MERALYSGYQIKNNVMGGAWGRGELQRDEVCSDINSGTVTAVVWTKKNKQFVIMVSFKDKVGSRSPRI